MAMKDVTMHPHADGTAPVRAPGGATANLVAHQQALEEAYISFVTKYERAPIWDIIRHRGCHSTTTVVVEIWEEA